MPELSAANTRGKLKIYMGYAAGVGKTFKMLEEAQELQGAGVDVAVGYFEPHARKDTIAKTEGLELIPRRQMQYRGAAFLEMDTDAILTRHPRVCVVDEFPHTNVPGAERAKRWEDVEVLRDNGIDVLTTMNIQHLESLNDQIRHITGVQVRETIPDWVVRRADEVVMVDLTPRALLNRLERGVIYSPDKAERARENFFRESSLAALRELALREAAHEVEQRIGNGEIPADETHPADTGVPHKILIVITADPETARLIRRARRVGDFLHAECFAVSVVSAEPSQSARNDNDAIERHLNFARNLHIETRVLEGEDVAATLVDFARRNQITQIFLSRPRERLRIPVFSIGLVQKIVRLAKDMQVVIVSERETAGR